MSVPRFRLQYTLSNTVVETSYACGLGSREGNLVTRKSMWVIHISTTWQDLVGGAECVLPGASVTNISTLSDKR